MTNTIDKQSQDSQNRVQPLKSNLDFFYLLEHGQFVLQEGNPNAEYCCHRIDDSKGEVEYPKDGDNVCRGREIEVSAHITPPVHILCMKKSL